MKLRYEKHEVCVECFAVGILFPECICTHEAHDTIVLEFAVCDCCGNILEDGHPADTKFNKNQLEANEASDN